MATKLIVGIGNIGPEYKDTRHNVGFMVLDYIAKKLESNDFEENKKLDAEVSKTKFEKTAVILAKPHTFVNKTGDAVLKLSKFYKVKPEDIIIMQDDLDIPFGNTKMSFDKNSGGHRGIESIMKSIKTKEFHRIRIGLGTRSLAKARDENDKKRDEFVVKMVLSKFSKSEIEELKSIFKEAYEKVLLLLR